MKNGLYKEEDKLIYYQDDRPTHAGVVKIEDKIYYIGRHGYAVIGVKNVHREMCNGILERGTYTFDENGVLIPGSYIKPKSSRRKTDNTQRTANVKGKRYDIKKLKKALTPIVCLICVVSAFLILSAVLDDITDNHLLDNKSGLTEEDEIILPAIEGEIVLCSEYAKKQYDGEIRLEDVVRLGSPYQPLVYEYTLDDKSGSFFISEYQDFRKSSEYVLFPGSNDLIIDNLKTGTQYYYKISVGNQEHYGTFKTAKSTRFINMPGVYNTRDIGGYVNLEGKNIKQGMIIRGSEIDGLVEKMFFLEEDSIDYISDSLGFVFDMDLRSPGIFSGEYQSRLNGVRHKFYSAPQYGQVFSATYKESLYRIFSDLADPDNYPMYLHCTYGSDRTGTIIYLLYGILNMSEEDMLMEYQRTGYYAYTYAAENMNVINAGLENCDGATIQEKIVWYLTHEVGISFEDIQKIRKILLEE